MLLIQILNAVRIFFEYCVMKNIKYFFSKKKREKQAKVQLVTMCQANATKQEVLFAKENQALRHACNDIG
jgi:hypothetical protein